MADDQDNQKKESKEAPEKITANDYFKQYGINPDVERSNLTDEMALQILEKAASALNTQKEHMDVVESIKDGAFEILKILKAAGTVAVLLA